MTALTVAEVLEGAADLVEPEGAWTTDVEARDLFGEEVEVGSADAVCFCAGGAIWASARYPLNAQALNNFAALIGGDVPKWNDASLSGKARFTSASTVPELLPCPFCGGGARLGVVDQGGEANPDFGGHFVQCENDKCHACMGLRLACGDDARPELVAAWNTRPAADALATLRADEWQPIETAPKDGTWVWAFWPVQATEYQQRATRWLKGATDGPFWIDAEDWIDWTQPTHWRPLPAPPSVSGEAK